jgi:hypothetical protein
VSLGPGAATVVPSIPIVVGLALATVVDVSLPTDVVVPPSVVTVAIEVDVVGAAVVDGDAIDVDVLVDEVVVEPAGHGLTSSTEVEPDPFTSSAQCMLTFKVIVPVVGPGTMVVAFVEPLGGTVASYPVTAYDCAPIVAVIELNDIERPAADSLLPIVHVTT